MFTWHILRLAEGRIETVDAWPTLAAVIWEMACSAWEVPGNHLLSYVIEEATGRVAATAVFGPELDLLVTASDGRRWRFPVPEFYRDPPAGMAMPATTCGQGTIAGVDGEVSDEHRNSPCGGVDD